MKSLIYRLLLFIIVVKQFVSFINGQTFREINLKRIQVILPTPCWQFDHFYINCQSLQVIEYVEIVRWCFVRY